MIKYFKNILVYALLMTLMLIVPNFINYYPLIILSGIASFIFAITIFGYGILNIKEKQLIWGLIITIPMAVYILLYIIGFIVGALMVA